MNFELETGHLLIIKIKKRKYTYRLKCRNTIYWTHARFFSENRAMSAAIQRAAEEGIRITEVTKEDVWGVE